MIKYIKITTIEHICEYCNGKGFRYENEYHNQCIKRTCYMCRGNGKILIDHQEDVTDLVIKLLTEKNLPSE
jgi:DnaJ-class molecular chaperone